MKIEAININKSFKKKNSPNLQVLKDINLKIGQGETVSFMGASGAGKSTLIHILGLMDRPTSGKVLIDGKDCFDTSDAYLCKMRKDNIGFLFQFHYLLEDFNVLENVLLPVYDKKEQYKDKAIEILNKVGLGERVCHFPNELSGGEQQRAALARALINEPKIIFADEPTGNLDKNTGLEIENLIFKSTKELNATLVLVTHNEELAKKTGRIVNIADGKIQ